MTSETEYGFTLVIRTGDTNRKVEISGYCSEQDKEVLLATALKTYDAGSRGFLRLTLEEIEDIIKSNLTITDSRLYDGVYSVAEDIEIALKNKNELAVFTERVGNNYKHEASNDAI
jgi:hypothetical protein